MNTLAIFLWIYAAMICLAFAEASVEGRNAWDKKKVGLKLKFGKYVFSTYHFFSFVLMFPILLTLPLVIYSWDSRLFGIIMSAYFSGVIIEDFCWYVVNPKVKLREFWTSFSDYFPWIKINNKKIIPWTYVILLAIAILFWYFFWR